MNDRAVELLEQYEIEVLRTRKGRGAILCETSQGSQILKEYAGSQERIELQDRLLKQVAQAGLVQVEQIVPDREGALFVKDNDGVKYVLKTWQDGRECSIHDKGECVE
ncbi:MAG: CotS family spore coat protein, partial [Schaedlerella arabinosiphila]|nr:CotS family spore coat protein [Schaedlerella arabinosiphila]